MLQCHHVSGNTYYLATARSCIPFYLLDATHAVLMDSGLADSDQNILLAFFERKKIWIHSILTTHAHIDHVGNHRVFQEKHQSKLYLSLFNAAVCSNPLGLKAYFYGNSYSEMCRYAQSMFFTPDCVFSKDAASITIEGAVFEILDLPGHSPEHLGFVTPDGVAYLGDLLINREMIAKTRVPYSMCCSVDLACKKDAARLNYPHYLISHKGLYEDIQPLIAENCLMWEQKLQQLEKLVDSELSYECLLGKAFKIYGINLSSMRSSIISERSIRSMLQYLTESQRIIHFLKNGIIHFKPCE
ncbi:MBL fold metallo-hydrolase [Eubacterium barkeri]|uniref:Metallo-beta-lactamase superfamily protein n=1 Tax=Eubacterium barkeri TaxID=1528 RepID=A0A1H3JCI3_EUBBA|nr:MBL fold metallo-hydrolase [Eubacterium barkeri]SDY37279.1 Metallo-beta-lactamase superfamily protein [Eubacterium barkeri]